jgi:hypothetical protein
MKVISKSRRITSTRILTHANVSNSMEEIVTIPETGDRKK